MTCLRMFLVTPDDISHVSTSGMSDYSLLTSQDALSWRRSCTSVRQRGAHAWRARPQSLDIDAPSMRRTHSNPENCHSYERQPLPPSPDYGTLKASDRGVASRGAVSRGVVARDADQALDDEDETSMARVTRWLTAMQH